MKKVIYSLILLLVVVGGLAYANREHKSKNSPKSISKPLIASESKAALNSWKSTPDGIKFNNWKASPAGKKVYAGAAKIRKSIKEYSNMEGTVTSLSLPKGSKLGFGVMVNIKGEEYILAFGSEKPIKNILNFNNEFEQLHCLKVNDKIIIKSHSVSFAPKYSYPIIAGDYVERYGKKVYQRTPRNGGC